MSLSAACGWTLLRSLAIALLALPLCHLLAVFLSGLRGRTRAAAWVLLLVPFLTPELVVGYGYSGFSLSLVHHPLWKEFLYAALLWMRVVPVGTAAAHFAPAPAVSAEALHCRCLAIASSAGWFRRAAILSGLWWRGPLRRLVPAFLLMFLVAFQEFEIASLMWATAWTDVVMKLQAGGVDLPETLRQILLPVGCEAAVLLPGLALVLRSRRLPAAASQLARAIRPAARVAAWVYITVAAVAVCAVPFALVGQTLDTGLLLLWENRLAAQGHLRNIVVSAAFAAASTGAASLGVMALSRPGGVRGRAPRRFAAGVLCCAGLLGPLALGLFVLAVFRVGALASLYDSPAPLFLGLLLYLLPRVALLQVLLDGLRPREAVHAARLTARAPDARRRGEGRALLWRLNHRGRVGLAALACYWAYLDLTLAYLLRPSWVTTAPVELYNLMHFGRNDMLSALTLVTVAVPVFAVLLAASLRRPLARVLIR